MVDGKEICNMETKEGRRIYKGRTEEMFRRQGHKCALCWSWERIQFDHEAGRCAGKRDDRILDEAGDWQNAALCENCNSLKGSKRYKWVNGVYREVKKFQEVA